MECKCGFCVTCLLLLNSTTRFRWVACQLHLLEKHFLDYRILQKALASVPRTLGKTYARMLHEIPLRPISFWVDCYSTKVQMLRIQDGP